MSDTLTELLYFLSNLTTEEITIASLSAVLLALAVTIVVVLRKKERLKDNLNLLNDRLAVQDALKKMLKKDVERVNIELESKEISLNKLTSELDSLKNQNIEKTTENKNTKKVFKKTPKKKVK